MARAINEAMAKGEMNFDHVTILLLRTSPTGGIFKITAGLSKEFGERRVLTPVYRKCDRGRRGQRRDHEPAADSGYSSPTSCSLYAEIVLKAGMWRYVHGSAFTVPMVVRCPSGAAE